jgi:hypothetical protein
VTSTLTTIIIIYDRTHVVASEEEVMQLSNDEGNIEDMCKLLKVKKEMQDGRNPTTTGIHKVEDAAAKGEYFLELANRIENTTPNTPHPQPSIIIGHDIMNPMLYPESLEVVAKALQQGSLGKENMSQLVHFLHLLGGDLLDIVT